jgi:hypothetical protein
MATEATYTNIDSVEQQLRLLKQRRDLHASRLRDHFEALKDHQHRGMLLKDAAHDLFRAMKPAEMVGAALEPAKGLAPTLVQFLSTKGSFKRKLFFTALSMAAPALLKRVDLGKVIGTVSRLFGSKASHNGHTEPHPDEVIDPR